MSEQHACLCVAASLTAGGSLDRRRHNANHACHRGWIPRVVSGHELFRISMITIVSMERIERLWTLGSYLVTTSALESLDSSRALARAQELLDRPSFFCWRWTLDSYRVKSAWIHQTKRPDLPWACLVGLCSTEAGSGR